MFWDNTHLADDTDDILRSPCQKVAEGILCSETLVHLLSYYYLEIRWFGSK